MRLDNGNIIIQTVDFFTPIVDNPYQFGQIAAANALSDIYSMGGKPLFALNIVGFPINDLPKSILTEILQGGADKADEAGIPIVGGHSVDDREPKYGLVVTGEIDEMNMWKNSGAKIDDILILTKPSGTGVVATAIKKNVASDESILAAIESMSTLNKAAADILNGLNVNAVTDVTGYGLLGHLKEMCQGSDLSAKIQFDKLNFISGVRELAKLENIPGGTKRNLAYLKDYVMFDNKLSDLDQLLAADAQTSGGLLISLPEDDALQFIKYFGEPAKIIGKITRKKESLIHLI